MEIEVKAAVIVDQAEVNQILEVSFPMVQEAVQIKEKRARVKEKNAQIIGEKVIITVVMQAEVFYIGRDNRIYHQQEFFPAQILCGIVGAQAGMDVWLELNAEEFYISQVSRGKELAGKLFVTGRVILTKSEPLSIKQGTDYQLLVAEIVAQLQEEVYIRHPISPAPRLKKIEEIKVELAQLECKVLPDRLLVSGELKEDVYYVEEHDLACYWQEQFPFSSYFRLFGIVEGLDKGEITGRVKGVITEAEGKDGDNMVVKVVVELAALVYRKVQVQVQKGTTPVWGTLILGENIRERLLTDTWDLTAGGKIVRNLETKVSQIKGQAVAGQVLVEGVLEKEVFYIGEDRLEYRQRKSLPITDFIPIPEAEEGLWVHTSGRASSGGWEIKAGNRLEERSILELHACVLKPAVVYL
ncbi:MAG: DUF3794 domain-containing protein [bacterium]|jgi:hypothetical protein